MLFTRCPDCETTFRITDEALKKANGQVRCGRCASVFNAYAELHDPDAPPGADPSAETPPEAVAEAATPATPASQAGGAAAQPATPPGVTAAAPAAPSPGPVALDAARTALDGTLVADVVKEIEIGADDATRVEEPSDERAADSASVDDAISAEEVDDVLAASHDESLPTVPTWTIGASERRPASRWWAAGVSCALLALALQAVNHFRSQLAGHAVVGPWVQRAYAAIGETVTPRWDVSQYAILDWIATAEPNARGLGSLTITARIQNRGPKRQPYPFVRLRLKDRWEEAVGSRTFTPNEYLPSDTPRGRLMTAGETTRAELEVVDPGPDAYGFELDVCIESEPGTLSCGNDKIFL